MAVGDTAGPSGISTESPELSTMQAALKARHKPRLPFTPRQLDRIDEALTLSSRETGLVFSLYVGALDQPVRDHAERLHSQLAEPVRSVLIAVSPGQRLLEIVTGAESVKRLPDRSCALAALSMTAAFTAGDLTGGIVTGLRMLSDQAGRI